MVRRVPKVRSFEDVRRLPFNGKLVLLLIVLAFRRGIKHPSILDIYSIYEELYKERIEEMGIPKISLDRVSDYLRTFTNKIIDSVIISVGRRGGKYRLILSLKVPEDRILAVLKEDPILRGLVGELLGERGEVQA